MSVHAEKAMQRRYAKLPECAAYSGMSKRKLYELIQNGDLPVIKVSTRLHLIDIADIDRYFESRKVEV